MPTEQLFAKCPPFPTSVAVANIPTISFAKLSSHDELEESSLWNACRDHGFFLLDLKDSQLGAQTLQDAENMFELNTATLGLGPAVLDNYAGKPPKDLMGYKRAGLLRTDDGKKDAVEVYTLGQDDMMENCPPRKHPEPVETHREICKHFFRNAHAILMVLLAAINKQLDLPHGTLEQLCPLDKLSATSLRLLLTHAQSDSDGKRISFGGHTDIGIMTLLFNVAGGLQILPAGSDNTWENWRYIRPQPGCAVINIGDTLVEWTGGVVRSALHRVVSAPGAQATIPRQSLAYLMRAEDHAAMRRLQQGSVIPPLAEGEEDESRSVSDWSTSRAMQVMEGKFEPQTTGGRSLRP